MSVTSSSSVLSAVPWVHGCSILDDHLWHLDFSWVEHFSLWAAAGRVVHMRGTLEAHDGLGLISLLVTVDSRGWVGVLEL